VYKLLLILKYLRKRRIAWVSLVAVTLCTAMVLVVISVMGGWLRMFLDTNHALGGDVVIYTDQGAQGFGNYQAIIDGVKKSNLVKAAVADIETGGLATFNNRKQELVQIKAFSDMSEVGKINSFAHSLYREYKQPLKQIDDDPSLSVDEKARRVAALDAKGPTFDKPFPADDYRHMMPGAPNSGFDAGNLPGIICGTDLILPKTETGSYDRDKYDIYHAFVKLAVLDFSTISSATPSMPTRTYWLVDDSKTGLWQVDFNTVYVPFDRLQRDIGMAAQYAPDGKTIVRPAHVTEIQIAVNQGVDVYKARDEIRKIVDAVAPPAFGQEALTVESWDEHQAQFISAVEHEKVTLTFLFGIISIVAVFLVFCIFYMIVVEKTRDIGIIKSVGATNWGVAQIFLGYGLLIGIIGAGMGLLGAYLIVHNINELHAWMGREMGVKIWDPRTYIFDTIPNTMQAADVIWIVSIAILSAVGGAIVPAIRASRMHPVEALRWE